jgi:hypothetical protein
MDIRISTKKHDRNGQKSRIWIEEPKRDRYLSDNGFKRGTHYSVEHQENILILRVDPKGRLKVSGKSTTDGSPDRALMDINRSRDELPQFYPNGSNFLNVNIQHNVITITVTE